MDLRQRTGKIEWEEFKALFGEMIPIEALQINQFAITTEEARNGIMQLYESREELLASQIISFWMASKGYETTANSPEGLLGELERQAKARGNSRSQ